MTALDWAVSYIRRGMLPVPVARGEKAPHTKSWQKLRITEEEAPDIALQLWPGLTAEMIFGFTSVRLKSE